MEFDHLTHLINDNYRKNSFRSLQHSLGAEKVTYKGSHCCA